MADYTLPDLPYDYSALEPSISGTIMELHHSKHHQAYVTGANTALAQLAEARDSGNLANVNKLEKDLAFNLGGHVNHSIFWTNLSPDGGDKPTGELAAAIDDALRFVRQVPGPLHRDRARRAGLGLGRARAGTRIGQRLIIVQFFDQQGNLPAGIVPLLMLDVWEHAYYLDYKNVRADYVKAFWNIANWDNVQQRFAAAREKTSGLLLLS